LVPSFDGCDDFVWILTPAEGARLCVGFSQEPLDGGLKFDDGAEDAALQSPPGQLAK
jgi:hypothetical protein